MKGENGAGIGVWAGCELREEGMAEGRRESEGRGRGRDGRGRGRAGVKLEKGLVKLVTLATDRLCRRDRLWRGDVLGLLELAVASLSGWL